MVTQPTAKFRHITSSPYDDFPKPCHWFSHDISVADPQPRLQAIWHYFDTVVMVFIILKISVYWTECNVCKLRENETPQHVSTWCW